MTSSHKNQGELELGVRFTLEHAGAVRQGATVFFFRSCVPKRILTPRTGSSTPCRTCQSTVRNEVRLFAGSTVAKPIAVKSEMHLIDN